MLSFRIFFSSISITISTLPHWVTFSIKWFIWFVRFIEKMLCIWRIIPDFANTTRLCFFFSTARYLSIWSWEIWCPFTSCRAVIYRIWFSTVRYKFLIISDCEDVRRRCLVNVFAHSHPRSHRFILIKISS